MLNSTMLFLLVAPHHSPPSPQNAGVIGHLRNLFGNKPNEKPETHTHWVAESGVLDLYFLLGPQPADVSLQYAQLTGACMHAMHAVSLMPTAMFQVIHSFSRNCIRFFRSTAVLLLAYDRL